ncbi:hypothetical protein V500_07237, partial [Pseudogymnoascus sp. VKM F-4518 (FW-2643)]
MQEHIARGEARRRQETRQDKTCPRVAMALSHHEVVTPRLRGDGIATYAARANQELAGVHWRERDSHGDHGDDERRRSRGEGPAYWDGMGWDSMTAAAQRSGERRVNAVQRARYGILQSSPEDQSVAPALSCLNTAPHASPTINGLKMASKRASHSNFHGNPHAEVEGEGQQTAVGATGAGH